MSEPLCPNCKERPRYRHPGGKLDSYCLECKRAKDRACADARRRQKGIPTKVREMCPRCQERPKHVNARGRRQGYCLQCLNETARARYAARHGNQPVPPADQKPAREQAAPMPEQEAAPVARQTGRLSRAKMLNLLDLVLRRRLARFLALARELNHAEARSAALDVEDLVEVLIEVAGGRK